MSGQSLDILGQIEDLNGHVLSKMRGKILWCNNHNSRLLDLTQNYKGYIEEVVMLDNALFLLVTRAYFSMISRYGSGFGGYESSSSSSIILFTKK